MRSSALVSTTRGLNRRLAASAVVILTTLAIACGSSSPTAPSPGSGSFNQTITGTVATFGTTRHALAIPRAGQMTVRLTWASAAVDLDLFLAPGSCVQLHPTSTCGVLAVSDAAAGVSEEIVRSVTSGDAFSVFVDNLSPSESQSYTITVAIP